MRQLDRASKGKLLGRAILPIVGEATP